MKRIAIIGAGITGLAVAWFLKRKYPNSLEIEIFEARGRVGGWIQSFVHKGFHFEGGPRGFRPAKATLQLVSELGLSDELIEADEKARHRYIAAEGKLHLVSPWYLIKNGALSALIRDLTTPSCADEDESIEAFSTRRFSRHIFEAVMDPLAKGIFGGDASSLSIRSCFPKLWEADQKYGSVLKGFIKSKRKKKGRQPALYTFRKGMERFPQALAAQLECPIYLNRSVNEWDQITGDAIISALPGYALARLLKCEDPFDYATLSLVHLGWNRSVLDRKGYGFLVPSKERGEILGMTWDSEMFPQLNVGEQTRITVMIRGSFPDEELYARAKRALSHYLGISEPPHGACVSEAIRALTQYHPFHYQKIKNFRDKLPPHVYALGSSFESPAINDLIAQAKQFADDFSW